ncbi:hypothetical protein P8452_16288 [Trifolium repens]|nr:hypothetical protein P8452_16288 [Trifolium repens]
MHLIVYPAFTTRLRHLRSNALDDFKTKLGPSLDNYEGFASSVQTWTQSIMLEFDKGAADACVRQANWDASKARDKLRRDIDSHADSDAVWNQFLPSDPQFIDSIISHSPSLANIPTKKALFLALSHRPIIIDNGKKQLDRKSGKWCYMLAARSLDIAWGDDDRYWNWIAMPDSRFPEVAKLRNVWWFHIHGMINMLALSPNTQYAAYLVFKMVDAYGFQNQDYPVELSIGVEGGHSTTKIVYLDTDVDDWQHNRVVELPRPIVRSDGWLEIEIGEFFNPVLEDEKVEMNIKETSANNSMRGLFLEGIEVRPK